MTNIKLSVIIPVYNEQKNLDGGSIEEVYDYLEKQKYDYEVLIIDDGSSDKSSELIQTHIKNKKNFKLVSNPHNGKAVTVMDGLLKAKGDFAVFTDMDQATPIGEIEKFFAEFQNGANIVIGSRKGRKGAPLVRKLAALGFALMRNIILGLPFSDTQCGFKAFDAKSREVLIPQLLRRWQRKKTAGPAVNAGFDVEMLFVAKKKELNIAEVEVSWHHVGTERVQIIRDAFEAISDMLRIRINDLLGKY